MSSLVKFSLAVVAIWLIVGNAEAGWLGRLFGGANDERLADGKVRDMVKTVEPQIKQLYPGDIASIEPLTYKTQVVAGTNYLIKAKVTDTSNKQAIIHLRLWQSLSNGLQFGAMRTKVDETTPLGSFMQSDV